MNKKLAFALGAIVCLCFCSSAKTSTFPVKLPLKSYAAYCQKAFDITISTPKGFADMEQTGAYSPFSKNGNIAPTCVMGAFAKSNDSQCVVMFGDLRFPVSKEEITSALKEHTAKDRNFIVHVSIDKELVKKDFMPLIEAISESGAKMVLTGEPED